MDRDFIRKAVEEADLNALRLALLQATGDPEYAAIPVNRIEVRAGAGTTYVVAAEHREALIDMAVAFLSDTPESHLRTVPSDEHLRHMMELVAGGEPISDKDFDIRKPVPAFDAYPRCANWSDEPVPLPEDFQVVIVGAGFSGLGMAVQLERLGIPYVIYERRSEIGGTWSINTYPDARVDTPSAMYEFSFEKLYPWTEHFARQAEVRAYLEHIARKFRVFEKIRFNHEIKGGRFDEVVSLWRLDIVDGTGTRVSVAANHVISASGLFSTPRALSVEGIDQFEGEIVHSTEWDERHSASGKAVAVVGNGSTGVQLLGRISDDAKQTYVFQRTPQWISPRERYGEAMSSGDSWLRQNMPYYWNWTRYTGTLPVLNLYQFLVPDPEWQASGGLINQPNDALREAMTQYIVQQVEGRADLVEQLVPQHAPFSRRLIVDNGWYRSLLKQDVELVTAPIARLTRTGIVTADGAERKVDMIVSAIGFSVEKYVWPSDYVGRDGAHLQERWSKDGARAYLGMMIDGFPNFFVLYGPNSQSVSGGGGTIPTQIEMWTKYVAQLIVDTIERGHAAVEVTPAAFEGYNERMDEAATGLIWLTDTQSTDRNYYVKDGRLQVNMPWHYQVWHEMLAKPDLSDMTLSGRLTIQPVTESTSSIRLSA
ncbi:NAD(P)/FAD-dependent oxidoreductase [Sphingomonas sp. CL5.1]|uniref:flavin-containing monooxygenase n=1 Tax=Sphingomonas sp. CL5.1 TaxID=2653203 RepID=UPI001582DA3B|nr:NAD(P)/FAD-dependent oxidoreductase [Sphingomonas sp. CL5.1]QKS00254.1 NAD(P)/FAD-dependent oxidoreductase [Sphingomonas sp. CL5.1]